MVLFLLNINKIMITMSSQQKTWCYVDRLVLRQLYSATLFVRNATNSSLFTESRRNCIQFGGSLVPPETLRRTPFSLFSRVDSRYQVHRHPKQRPLFCYSDCRYKGWRRSPRSHQRWSRQWQEGNEQWQHHHISYSRIVLEDQAVAAGWYTSKAQTCYLGDEDFQIRTMTEGMTVLRG